MARSEEMSRDGGSTRTMGSSSPVAKELDAVSETLPLFEGQRSPAMLNDEVKEVDTMNHSGVSPSPMGQRSPAKISQVFSEALRQDCEVTEGDEEDQEEGEIDAASLEEEIDIVELKRRNLVRGESLAVQIEDEENDDCQEEGEIDLLELKRRNLVRDKALAERELMYIDEIRAQKTGLVDKAFGHDTKKCKKQTQSETKSEWVKVGKGKATVTNFIVSPPEHTEPSSSNFPVIQNATPEADNLAPPSGEQQEMQEPQIEEQEQEGPEVDDQVMLNDRGCWARHLTPTRLWVYLLWRFPDVAASWSCPESWWHVGFWCWFGCWLCCLWVAELSAASDAIMFHGASCCFHPCFSAGFYFLFAAINLFGSYMGLADANQLRSKLV
ncbi:hypothetical protein U1Q18_000918 [Sarracenia purpurea var. burkii]